jgi:hypothetical protein
MIHARPNVTLNNDEIEFIQHLIKSYRDAYGIPDAPHEPNTIYAYLKRMERKMAKAAEHPDTEFV